MLYSIGDPTDEEQLYLEYINRSRANPPAEGVRLANTTDPDVLSAFSFFTVDLGLMQSQFNTISPVPPLAMNAQLLFAARLHSGDMFTNEFQGHDASDGSNLGQRASAQGYNWSSLAENVYSYAKSSSTDMRVLMSIGVTRRALWEACRPHRVIGTTFTALRRARWASAS